MKFLLAFAIIAIVLTVVYGAPDPWNEYKNKHSKKYSATEDAQRKKNFLTTDAMITKHNSQKNVTYQLGHNKFSDMTPTELSQYRGAVKPANKTRSLEAMVKVDMEARALPISQLDYRTDACLPPVKNQGQCGSCWAFAAITPLEFAQCKKDGSRVTLSEQQLVDCDTYDYGCSGGWYTNAWDYLQSGDGGSTKESLYPYTATDATCKFTSSMIGAKVSTYIDLPARNPTNMQAALQTYGPLAVAITVTDSFYLYKSGIYKDVACDNQGAVNHGVVVVGYGTLSGTDYWIVRNSWGSSWGSMGYILMQRGVNMCNIEINPAAVTVKKELFSSFP